MRTVKRQYFQVAGLGLAQSQNNVCPVTPDPCSAEVYKELDDPTRSATYMYDGSKPSDYLWDLH